jgi:hypothetical protein
MDENLKKLIMLYKESIHKTCSHFLDKNIWENYTWMKSKKLKVFWGTRSLLLNGNYTNE